MPGLPDVPHVAIVGAGIGGLACAARLATAGLRVTVLEAQAGPGGKMRQLHPGGVAIDSGPTVLTMRWVFDELFAACGESFQQLCHPARLDVLARHVWPDGASLDLFADPAATRDAIAALCGPAEARGFDAFRAQAACIHDTLEASFIRAPRPSPLGLVRAAGLRGLPGLARIAPFTSLHRALCGHFRDPRLVQLFGRYATYCGASPHQAPATLMLVAHVEMQGVWTLPDGMHGLAVQLARIAAGRGATLRYDAKVARLLAHGGQVTGLRLADDEMLAADAVVLNADHAALAQGLFGPGAGVPDMPVAERSLSALTWSMQATAAGRAMAHHNVFFPHPPGDEFAAIFTERRLPADPTLYLCASDRAGHDLPTGPERLFCIANAPADGDTNPYSPAVRQHATDAMHAQLQRCGLELTCHASQMTTPAEFARLFPATGGALYGPVGHGAMASFKRPGARTRIANLVLAGGSVHPGPGVPMAALSGAQAAQAILHGDSIRRSRRTAIAGGMSTR